MKRMADATKRGAFILFEGIDRCGKSTQSLRLVEKLNEKGIPAVHMRFPDRTTTIGTMIDGYLRNATELDDRCIHLLFSANRWEARKTILDHLSSGKTIVCDRYAYSGIAFSGAKGLSLAWCRAPEVGLPKPDAVFYLKLEIEEALKRGGFGGERYEKAEMQAKVKHIFENELMDSSWVVIDANQTPDALHDQILSLASGIVTKVPGTTLAEIS